MMRRHRHMVLFLCALLVSPSLLRSQERFRLADPQALSAAGSGWSVDPRTGGLGMVLPVAQAGLEIPILISLRVSGQFKAQSAIESEYVDPDPFDPTSKPRWTYVGTSDVVHPAFATVHLGYIAPSARFDGPTGSEIIVLEDGAQFRSEDLVPFTSWNPTITLPQDFSFPAVVPSDVKVTKVGSHALYSATSANLGATWGGRILALSPVGYGAVQDAYRLLMDKDRARVFVQLPDQGPWVPILWVDRFGHYVELKWQKDIQNLPSGVTAKYTLRALNQRGQGALLQWADFTGHDIEQDLLCADLLGMGDQAISIVVKGYPGLSGLRPQGAPSGNPTISVVTGRVAGPVGRPTHVQIGQVPVGARPAWADPGSGGGLMQLAPSSSGQAVILRSWSFAWDGNRSAITTMTDALGTRTTFTYSALTIPTTQTLYYPDPTDEARLRYRLGDLSVWGVRRADSYDPKSGKTLSRTWTPGTSGAGEPTVQLREIYGDPTAAPRWTELVYAPSTDASGRDYGNGAIKESRLWEVGSGSPSATAVYTLQGAGLGASYTVRSGMVINRRGEPTRTVAYQLDDEGLHQTAQTLFVGAVSQKVQESQTIYEALRDKLISGRPTQVTETRFGSNGTALSPTVVRRMEYDPKGLPSKSYRVVGSGQQGISYIFDGEGRLTTGIPFSDRPFTAPPFTSYGYDVATGLMSSQSSFYAPDGSATRIPLTRTFSDFDGFGKPRTIQDEKGLITRQEYDPLGRPLKVTPPAGEATTINYPDEWTRVTTRGSVITTEHTDGFGRLISRDLPDGSGEEISYDEFGRQEARIAISSSAAHERRNAAQTLYDALDRPTTITSPGGASQGLTYAVDTAYPLWSLVTRTLNTPVTVSTTKDYQDALGQVVRQVSPKGDITESSFDGMGSLIKVVLTPAGNGTAQIREFKYDEGGRMKERSEPETGTTLFSDFNGFGQPGTITEAGSRVRTLAYDGLGRMVRMSGGKESLTYTFNKLDLISASSLSDGVEVRQRFEYNGPAKQLSLEETTQPGLLSQTGYGYDPVTAQMNTIIYPNGRVVGYTRDALGRITAISQNSSPVVSKISFDEWGNRSRLSFASGAYSDWKAKDFGVHLDQWNIGYVAGNGTSTTLDGTRFFQYDSAERLTMAGDWDHLEHDAQGQLTAANSSSLAINTSHSHDAYDNNTSHSMGGAGLGAVPSDTLNPFAFDPMSDNRVPLKQANGSPSGWVINGRGEATLVGVATGSTQSLGLGWDGLGRLRAVVYGGGTQSYLYAPSGMRVALMESASVVNNRRYAYTSGGLLLSEYAEATSGGTNTLLASSSTTTTKTKIKTKHTKNGLAYMLPPGEDPLPAGAWIVQPGGPTTVLVGQIVTFVGGTDYGSTLTWTFGDGATASGATASHAYAVAGTYTVSFRAARVGYLAETATVQITVALPAGPAISSFAASPSTIGAGGYADLSWNVNNATSVSISGVGSVAALGTVRVWPTSTTAYVLTASSSGGTSTSTVQITVVPAPVIQVFVSEPASIQPGQAAKLTWTVSNATSYSLDQGIGAVNGTWATVWPGTSQTFTLIATNQQNGVSVTRTASTTVYVGAASSAAWKRDVIYLGSEAVAEIDAAGIHELHNNHLGSPTIITNGSAQIEGRQVFGPYGERVKSEGYVPLTGYTGHVQRDATGLIYMRGRFYSPAWHRFVNSDQGVDLNSWNQMAYVGGSPFHATDPSGMNILAADTIFEALFGWMFGGWGWFVGGGSGYSGEVTVFVDDAMPHDVPFADASYSGGLPDLLTRIPGREAGGIGGISSPQTPQPKPCNGKGIRGGGVLLGASAETAFGAPIIAGNGSIGTGYTADGNLTSYASGGTSTYNASSANQKDWGYVAEAGAGVGIWLTNANNGSAMAGTVRTTTVTALVVQFQWGKDSNGTWTFSVSAGKGVGLGVTKYDMTTVATSSNGPCQ